MAEDLIGAHLRHRVQIPAPPAMDDNSAAGVRRKRTGLGGKLVLLSVVALWGQTMIGYAESLPDPTRPPGRLDASLGPGGPASAQGGPVLQSVIISPTRRAAIISGETVELGGRYGDAKLVKVTESEAVLKAQDTVQTLKLFPEVEKRLVKPAPEKARKGTPRGGHSKNTDRKSGRALPGGPQAEAK